MSEMMGDGLDSDSVPADVFEELGSVTEIEIDFFSVDGEIDIPVADQALTDFIGGLVPSEVPEGPDDPAPAFAGDDSPVTAPEMQLTDFDPDEVEVTAGSPWSDMENWHEQETDVTCSIAAQEFVLESLTGEEFEESDLQLHAQNAGFFLPGEGTLEDYSGALIESAGFEVEDSTGNDIDDLRDELAQGHKVIAAVDAYDYWYPEDSLPVDEQAIAETGAPEILGPHVVQVIGIVDTPEGEMVVLNDSGTDDGQGKMVPVDLFLDAWEDRDGKMTVADPYQGTDGPDDEIVAENPGDGITDAGRRGP